MSSSTSSADVQNVFGLRDDDPTETKRKKDPIRLKLPIDGCTFHRFCRELTFIEQPIDNNISSNRSFVTADAAVRDFDVVVKPNTCLAHNRGTPWPNRTDRKGVSLVVLREPLDDRIKPNQSPSERQKYAHTVVREAVAKGIGIDASDLKCFVSSDPAEGCDKVGIYWDFNRAMPDEDRTKPKIPWYHHALASPNEEVALDQLKEIAQCKNAGWTPCQIEGSADVDLPCYPRFDDEHLTTLVYLMDAVINAPLNALHVTVELRYLAALAQYTLCEHSKQLENYPQRALAVVDPYLCDIACQLMLNKSKPRPNELMDFVRWNGERLGRPSQVLYFYASSRDDRRSSQPQVQPALSMKDLQTALAETDETWARTVALPLDNASEILVVVNSLTVILSATRDCIEQVNAALSTANARQQFVDLIAKVSNQPSCELRVHGTAPTLIETQSSVGGQVATYEFRLAKPHQGGTMSSHALHLSGVIDALKNTAWSVCASAPPFRFQLWYADRHGINVHKVLRRITDNVDLDTAVPKFVAKLEWDRAPAGSSSDVVSPPQPCFILIVCGANFALLQTLRDFVRDYLSERNAESSSIKYTVHDLPQK